MAEHVLCSSEVVVLDSDDGVIDMNDDCDSSPVYCGRVDYGMVSLRSGIVSRALYTKPAALASEHAVITIRNPGIGGDKRVIMLPMVCLSGTVDPLLPKVYGPPSEVAMRRTASESSWKRYVTPRLVIHYQTLLQSNDLERETPKVSSQLLSMQALEEGYRVMKTEDGDIFYGQTNTERAQYMFPSSDVVRAHIRHDMGLPRAAISINRFSNWDDVRDFCCL